MSSVCSLIGCSDMQNKSGHSHLRAPPLQMFLHSFTVLGMIGTVFPEKPERIMLAPWPFWLTNLAWQHRKFTKSEFIINFQTVTSVVIKIRCDDTQNILFTQTDCVSFYQCRRYNRFRELILCPGELVTFTDMTILLLLLCFHTSWCTSPSSLQREKKGVK